MLFSETGINDDVIWGRHNATFVFACALGHLSFVKFLVYYYGFNADSARQSSCGALRVACQFGHLSVVKFLASQFHLRHSDFLVFDDCSDNMFRQMNAVQLAKISANSELSFWINEIWWKTLDAEDSEIHFWKT